jgi:hypothetical protein
VRKLLCTPLEVSIHSRAEHRTTSVSLAVHCVITERLTSFPPCSHSCFLPTMPRKSGLSSFHAVLYAFLARVRKLLACVRAPLRLVLSFFRAFSSWLASHGSCRPGLPPAQRWQTSHDKPDDVYPLEESWSSASIVCASRVPDSLTPDTVPDTGSMRGTPAASSTSVASSRHSNHTHHSSHAHNDILAVPSSPYAFGHPGVSFHNIAVPAVSSPNLVHRAISTPNLPDFSRHRTPARTSIRQAEARSRSRASRVSGRRPPPMPNQSFVTLAIVRHVHLMNHSLADVAAV